MQPEDRDIAFLWDILEAAKDIHDFVRKMTIKDFGSDKRTRYAVERQLLVIGEAAKRVSESYLSLITLIILLSSSSAPV
jgi:uncharacterized protein with HEPN domain